MFGDNFMAFPGDFNFRQDTDLRLPDFRQAPDHRVPGEFLPSFDTNPFQFHKAKSSGALDLCKKLNKMGISCDMTIWNNQPQRVDPVDFGSHGFDPYLPREASLSFDDVFSTRQHNSHGGSQTELRLLALQETQPQRVDPRNQNPGLDGFFSPRHIFHQNNNLAASPNDIRLLALQDSLESDHFRVDPTNFHGFNPNLQGGIFSTRNNCSSLEELRLLALQEMVPPLNNNSHVAMEQRPIKRSLFEGNRVFSKALAAIQPSPQRDEPMTLDLASMISIYGSVDLMARDQIASRFLQKVVANGKFLDVSVIVHEVLSHVVELSKDPFGNYLIQSLLEVCNEEMRTMMVRVLTSRPIELIKLSLNTYGTRVVQRMIETVKTKQEVEMVKSGLKPGFLTLVKDLNGNHVLQTCLHSFGPDDHKFVLEAATKYCAEIATHRHGCCVLQCCISSAVGFQQERLVAEIARHSLQLSQDPFGNYVVQYLIDQRVPSVNLLHQFRMHYAELATQKFSSHVVERCLKNYPESRSDIVRELLSVPNFEHILQDPFANYVIQTALNVTKGRLRDRLEEKVYRCGKLRSSPYCKKIFSKNILKKSP